MAVANHWAPEPQRESRRQFPRCLFCAFGTVCNYLCWISWPKCTGGIFFL